MEHLRSLDSLYLRNAWVTIGSFDGVHRGHQAILTPLVAGAHAAGDPAVVITFYPHPARVLRGIEGPYYLTSPEERADALAALGVDVVVTLAFTPALAALSADEFMQQLSTHLGLHRLWVGYDFALGRGRQGDVTALRQIGERLGYELDVIAPVRLDEATVSSSQIRALVAEGSVAAAAQLLGRWYSISGPVVHGDARGRRLGIPTANLQVDSQRLLPLNGVYATRLWADDRPYPAVTNVGVRPTFENQPVAPRVEAHLLDFSSDLYSQTAKLEFIEFIRPEQRFESPQALLEQIQKDTQRAREVLAHAPHTPGLSAGSAKARP